MPHTHLPLYTPHTHTGLYLPYTQASHPDACPMLCPEHHSKWPENGCAHPPAQVAAKPHLTARCPVTACPTLAQTPRLSLALLPPPWPLLPSEHLPWAQKQLAAAMGQARGKNSQGLRAPGKCSKQGPPKQPPGPEASPPTSARFCLTEGVEPGLPA